MRCPGWTSIRSRRLLVVLLLGSLVGCVRVTWRRVSRYVPPEVEVLDGLRIGETTLSDALRGLGAPLWTWEVSQEEFALAWGWFEDTDAGGRVSVPITRGFSPSFSFDRFDERMQGLVLFFDMERQLVATRRGLLRDLSLLERRRRPLPAAGEAPSEPAPEAPAGASANDRP